MQKYISVQNKTYLKINTTLLKQYQNVQFTTNYFKIVNSPDVFCSFTENKRYIILVKYMKNICKINLKLKQCKNTALCRQKLFKNEMKFLKH